MCAGFLLTCSRSLSVKDMTPPLKPADEDGIIMIKIPNDSPMSPKAGMSLTMDELPVELVAQIMHMLPLAQVFVCMSVSRSFREAAMIEMDHRDCLIIGSVFVWRPLADKVFRRVWDFDRVDVPNHFFDSEAIVKADNDKKGSIMRSLLHMSKLKRLLVHGMAIKFILPLIQQNAETLNHLDMEWRPPAPPSTAVRMAMAGIPNTVLAHDFCHLPPLPNTDIAMPSLKRMHLTGSVEMSRHFILKNAATITLLDIPGQLPSHRDHDIVYDCLRELSCTRVGRNAASLCPALRHLKLEVGYGYDRLRQVVDEISELVHLKSLYFNYCRGGERMEREVETFFNLFDGQHELEEVSLSFGCRNWYHLTRLIDKLVKNNPSLKRLCLEDITMTNSCLQPLCALQHLERLVLGYQSEVTSAGIKALLRGGSRHVLQQLHFSYQTIMDEVREEVDRVNEEKKWMYLPLTASSRLVLQTRAQSYF